MKYVMLIPDGAADLPLDELGGKTPLEAANIPFLDLIAREGIGGTVRTIPPGIGTGSDVASLSLLGYDPRKYYTGRGPLEAAYHGIELKKGQIAYRCNLITEKDGALADYSSGHITSDEAAILIRAIDDALGTDKIEFHPGVSYRHLMILKEGGSPETKCYPPHDVLGRPIKEVLPSGYGANLLIDLINRSPAVLRDHEINKKRIAADKNPGNMIWPWGQGPPPHLTTFRDRFGIEGSVITAVDVIKGIGIYSGLDVINVNGATGYYDTNYEEKARSALASLKMKDFVFVHVEAPDEAGHEGDAKAKIKALEDFDNRTVRSIMEGLPEFGDYRVLVVPDHATPCSLRTHDPAPVPFALYSSNGEADGMPAFDEKSANEDGSIHLKHGEELIRLLIDS
jgi:2,3-bisphosphoglycerate-independent phosphoglycerate mutase